MDAHSQAAAVAQEAGGGLRTWKCSQVQLPPPPEEGHRDRLVELPASFRELFTFFCANATMHGAIRLVCSQQNRLKTASWGLLFLGALGVLYWQFGLLFEQYWHYPVIMTVSVHSDPKLFPAVTLCDMNPHRPRLARRHLQALDQFAQENIHALYKFNCSGTGDALSAEGLGPEPSLLLDRTVRLQRLSGPDGQSQVGFRLCNSSGSNCFYRAYSSGVTAVRVWYLFHYVNILAALPTAPADDHQSHGHPFIFSCRYDGQDCQAQHFHTFHHPTYGSCYTFNGTWATPHPGLSHSERQSKQGVGGAPHHPMSDSCYTHNCEWAARHPGLSHGISLVLRAAKQDHLPLLSTEAGIKVMVHKRNHTPFLEHHGFSIRPGTETTIGIREDEVRRLGSPYSNCTEDAEGIDVRMLYNTSYTMQACLISCFQQLMLDTCSCGYYFYPLPPGAKYCSSAQHPAWGHCFYRLYRKLETHQLPCTSSCPRPCRESSYKLSAGTARWPSSTSEDWILAVLGKWSSQSSSRSLIPRSNVAKVNIFYQELNYRTGDETPVYSVPQLLSAMGSLWSLWFGSSVLSVLELLELLLDATALALLLGCRRLCHT